MLMVQLSMIGFGSCFLAKPLLAESDRNTTPAHYSRITVEDSGKMLKTMPKDRPRLFIGKNGLQRLAENSRLPDGKALMERIIYDANLMLNYPPCERKMDGRRLLLTSQRILYRVNTLSMAYLLTQNQSYATRAIAEMTAAAGFQDWNPSHFLDVGEMTLALAVGYDWLHDRMSADERALIRDAIIEKGLKASLTGVHYWIACSINWSPVCHCGMLAGALAVYEDEPQIAAAIIHRAVVNLPKAMESSYSPEGAYPEGPMYWKYGTEFNVALLGMLIAAFDTDFGLSAIKGFDKTLDFISATTNTPSGLRFNYGDGSLASDIDLAQIWLIDRFNRIDRFTPVARQNLNRTVKERPASVEKGGNRMLPLAMRYLREYPDQGSEQTFTAYFSGKESLVPISVHRSDSSNHATYLAMKAGMPSSSHGHMDGGSFIIESDGIRWAVDLGTENYFRQEAAKVDLWNNKQNSQRWKLFRLGPASHNILVIDNQEQNVKGDARIIEFSGDKNNQYTLVDLTPLYAGQLAAASRRGIVHPDRKAEIIDTLDGLKPGAKIRWQMCLQNVEATCHGNVLELRKDNKSMTVSVAKPAQIEWKLTPAEQLMGQTDSPNPNTMMATFEVSAPADGKLELAVLFTPGNGE